MKTGRILIFCVVVLGCLSGSALAFDAERCLPDKDGVLFSNERVESCQEYAATPGLSDHDKAMALYYLGYAYTQHFLPRKSLADSMKRVRDTWEAATKADPEYEFAFLALAQNAVSGGNPEDGLNIYRTAQRLAPFDWRVYAGKAQARLAANDAGGALMEAEIAVALAPGSKWAMLTYADTLNALRRYSEAAEAYLAARRPIDAPPPKHLGLYQDRTPWSLAALMLHLAGKHAEAAEQTRQMLATIEPRDWQFVDVLSLARYEEAAGEYEAATRDFEKAIAMPDAYGQEEIETRININEIRAGNTIDSAVAEKIINRLQHADLHQIVTVQEFLKNNGFATVDVDGKFGDVTRTALLHCLADKKCAADLNRKI